MDGWFFENDVVNICEKEWHGFLIVIVKLKLTIYTLLNESHQYIFKTQNYIFTNVTLPSGASGGNLVEVQVFLPAP